MYIIQWFFYNFKLRVKGAFYLFTVELFKKRNKMFESTTIEYFSVLVTSTTICGTFRVFAIINAMVQTVNISSSTTCYFSNGFTCTPLVKMKIALQSAYLMLILIYLRAMTNASWTIWRVSKTIPCTPITHTRYITK